MDSQQVYGVTSSTTEQDELSIEPQVPESTLQSITESNVKTPDSFSKHSNPGVHRIGCPRYLNAKSLLVTTGSERSGINLYEHLVEVLKKVFTHQPINAVDVFEDISRMVKREVYTDKTSTLINSPEMSTEAALAFIQKRLYETGVKNAEEAAEGEDEETTLPDLPKIGYYLEQSGLGINREEMFRIWLSLRELAKGLRLQTIRFWGKLFGLQQNYYVAEVEFEEGEGEEVEEQQEEAGKEEEDMNAKPVDNEATGEEGEEPRNVPDIPQPKWKPPPVVPTEEFSTGINRKVYYVCNEPGKPWRRLPKVTPAQIQTARLIKKYLTGNLDYPINSYPPFPGMEINYLRAQIARISSSTHVSPRGYFHFDDEEEDEEGGAQDFCVKNAGYEGLTLNELIDPSLENWVHHTKFLLPQGRCVWWNPTEMTEEMAEEEEEGNQQAEIGLPLLQALGDDKLVNKNPPWTVHVSGIRVPQFAHAYIESNQWPGSSAFAAGDNSENIYTGWGHKYSANNYSPPAPPLIMNEYKWGPHLEEVDDPTPEEEAALKAMLEPPPPKGEEGEEQEEEVVEEDELTENED